MGTTPPLGKPIFNVLADMAPTHHHHPQHHQHSTEPPDHPVKGIDGAQVEPNAQQQHPHPCAGSTNGWSASSAAAKEEEEEEEEEAGTATSPSRHVEQPLVGGQGGGGEEEEEDVSMFFTPELFEEEEDEAQDTVPAPPCRTDDPAATSIGLAPGQTEDVEECVSKGHGDGVVSVSVREDSAGPEQSLCHRPQSSSSSSSSRVEEQAEAAGALCQMQTESPCQQREECEGRQSGTRAHRLSRSSRQRAALTPSGKGHLTTPPITLWATSPQ